MDVGIFGERYEKSKPITLSIYADEIKKHKNSENERWFYMGILLIPEELKKIAIKKLKTTREESNYLGELKFSKLTNFSYSYCNNEKTLLANKWINLILNDKTNKCFYFNILGINYDRIKPKIFGNNKAELFQNMYNRFFRTLLKSSFKYFFNDRQIIIENIFHDRENNLEKHTYFDWHCIHKLNEEIENLSFNTDRIQFIDSNHNLESIYQDESHFIQLIDIILGSMRLCLDNCCTKDGCTEIAKLMQPLLERIMRKPNNKNSSYGYYKKYSIGFFPSNKINSELVLNPKEQMSSKIFHDRRMLFFNENQLELF